MNRKPGHVYYGWWVLIACAGIQLFFSATFMSGFTVFFNPIANEFTWSYAVVALASTFRGLEIGFVSPLVGFFVDRFGSRKLLLLCSVLGILGFFLFSQVHSLWMYFLAFVVLGISISLSSGVVVMPPIIKWFPNRPSLVIGILLSGSSLAGLLVPGIVWSVDNLGWRHTLEYFAIGTLIFCLPLCFLVKEPAVSDKGSTQKEKSKQPAPEKIIRKVIKQKDFWLLSLATAVAGFAPAAVTAHQIPYLSAIGISRETAGWMVVIFTLSGVIGRFGLGWLGDFVDKRYVFAVGTVLQAVGLLGFTFASSVPPLIPSLVVMGTGYGGVMTMRSALQLDLFGLAGFAPIQGLLLIFAMVGGMAAPPLVGWMFDSSHTYHTAWIGLTVVTFFAIPLVLLASKPGKIIFQQEN